MKAVFFCSVRCPCSLVEEDFFVIEQRSVLHQTSQTGFRTSLGFNSWQDVADGLFSLSRQHFVLHRLSKRFGWDKSVGLGFKFGWVLVPVQVLYRATCVYTMDPLLASYKEEV